MERLKLPGRLFTIAFTLLLLVGVVVGVSVAIRFQALLQSLENLRGAWPATASVLENRYLSVDEAFAGEAKASEDLLQRWSQLRSAFKASNQYDSQARLVGELESSLRSAQLPPEAMVLTAEDSSSLQPFIQADKAYEALQNDWLGILCKNLFRLNVPKRIYGLIVPGS